MLCENRGRPLSPEQVHFLVRDRMPGLGLATVYRTLELFCELGISETVHLSSGKNHYELKGEHRHYMECLSCGRITPIGVCPVGEVLERLGEESGFLVTEHCMNLFGYCAGCVGQTGGRRGKSRKAGKEGRASGGGDVHGS